MSEENFKERRSEMEIRERLVKVEESARTAAATVKEISGKVDRLIDVTRSQKSFLGGMVFVMTAIWAIIAVSSDWLLSRLK